MILGGIFSDIGNWWSSLFGDDGDPKTISKILTDYKQYLQYQDVFSWVWHTVLWGLIKLFYSLNQHLEKLIYQNFTLKDILKSAGFSELYQDVFNKISALLLVLTLLFVGLKFIAGKNPPKFKNIWINLFISMVILIGGSSVIDEGLNSSQKFYNDVVAANKENKSESPAFQLIKDNVVDISKVLATDPEKVAAIPTNERNALSADNFSYANINGVITPEQAKKEAKAIEDKDKNQANKLKSLQYKLELDDNGKKVPVKIDDTGLAQYVYTSGYRRYYSEPGVILVGEVSLTVAYLFLLFTIVTCIIELGFKKFYLMFAASTDLATGQRVKTAIDDVSQSFLLLAFTALEMRIYLVLLTGIADLHTKGTLTGFLYIIAMIVLTIALFKGSQAVTKIFGVDTSLKNGANSLMSAFALSNIAKNVGGGAKKVASAGKSGIQNLNDIRKNGLKRPSKASDTVDSTENDTQNSHIPQSNRSVSDVLGKGKEAMKKTAEGAGYLKERGLKGTKEDLKEKAKGSVKEKLAGTRASALAAAAKNPGVALDKASELKDHVKEAFGEGELNAALKANEKEPQAKQETKQETKQEPQVPKTQPTSPHEQKIPVSKLPKRTEEDKENQVEMPNPNGSEVGSGKSTKIDLPEPPLKNSDLNGYKEGNGTFHQQANQTTMKKSRLPENGNQTTVGYKLSEGSTASSLVTKETAPRPIPKIQTGYRPANVSFTAPTKITVSQETQAQNQQIKEQLNKE